MEKSTPAHCLQFLDLPIDIRWKIYEDYLEELCHPPASVIHEEPLSTLHQYWNPAILTVNKQLNEEVMHIFRTRTTFTLRTTWQECEYDGFTTASLMTRPNGFRYGGFRHLNIEIYPPHPDRPMDLVRILRFVSEWRPILDRDGKLQDLSIYFLENEIASWSKNGEAIDSLELWGREDKDGCWTSDITVILDHFGTISDAVKATIYLPESLANDEDVQSKRKITEKRMVAPFDLNKIAVHDVLDRQYDLLEEAETQLKQTTATLSRATIEEICEHGLHKVSPEELLRLKTIWPYTENLPDRDYFPDHKYTGVVPDKSQIVTPPPCQRTTKTPKESYQRKKALYKIVNNRDWFMCPNLRQEVSDILKLVDDCDPWWNRTSRFYPVTSTEDNKTDPDPSQY